MSYQDTRYSAKKFVAEKILKRSLTEDEKELVDKLVSAIWRDAVSYDPVWDSD